MTGRSVRLLYVVGQLGSGGQERQMFYLLRSMDRQRFKPGVVVWNYDKDEVYVRKLEELRVPVFYFPKDSTPTRKITLLRDIITSLQAEIIHSFSFYTNFVAWFCSVGTKAVPIGSVRSSLRRSYHENGMILGPLCSRFPNHQICNNRKATEEALTLSRLFLARHLYVVLNVIDICHFKPESLTINNGTQPLLVGIGSLTGLKRWDILISAVAEVKCKGFDLALSIAGDGPLYGTLSQLIESSGLRGTVRLLGQVENIPRLLAQSSLVVHTSDVEGSPNAVLEAMACGKAVVATDAGDVPYVVEDGVTGFVVERGNVERLAEKISLLLTQPSLRKKMGIAGRMKAERDFKLDRLVRETFAVYEAAGWKGQM